MQYVLFVLLTVDVFQLVLQTHTDSTSVQVDIFSDRNIFGICQSTHRIKQNRDKAAALGITAGQSNIARDIIRFSIWVADYFHGPNCICCIAPLSTSKC